LKLSEMHKQHYYYSSGRAVELFRDRKYHQRS